jgi:hypothetical protein
MKRLTAVFVASIEMTWIIKTGHCQAMQCGSSAAAFTNAGQKEERP